MKILSDEFEAQVAKELETDNDYQQANTNNTSIKHRYVSLLMKGKRELRKLEAMRVKEFGRLYNHFRFESDKAIKGITEINIYIDMDKGYTKLMRIINIKKLEIDTVEKTIDLFTDRSWAIKNAIQLLTLEK